jgi:signal transduction histidine kinase
MGRNPKTDAPGKKLSEKEALRERVKELTCLYGIAQIVALTKQTMDDALQSIVKTLPPAWQYPEVASAQILFDGKAFQTPGHDRAVVKQRAEIVVRGDVRGQVEVGYCTERPLRDEGPFLREERHLINAVASQVALIVERREAEREKGKLREQLRHADRLATIGQLAAGVAHELNEPLGNILGFAELIRKDARLDERVQKDVERIISASLYAREVIRKLTFFARRTPPQKAPVDLNRLVEDSLSFFEGRCAKADIRLERSFQTDLPMVTADSAQLNQVLVNIVVNAIQAMPEGGTLTVSTRKDDHTVSLMIRDTGVGMTAQVLKQIFVPFFTTKDVNEGTGLGLSVAHGIVSAHGGSIQVRSRPGQGACFTVRLPIGGKRDKETGQDDAERS